MRLVLTEICTKELFWIPQRKHAIFQDQINVYIFILKERTKKSDISIPSNMRSKGNIILEMLILPSSPNIPYVH